MKKFVVALLLVAAFVATAFAVDSPLPPQKGQWGFALEDSLPLYEKADADSDSEYVEFDSKWFSVPSAVRDSDNNLWYKVKIGKKSGWLAQNGVRLKLQNGGKSKAAAKIYKNKTADSLIGLSQNDIRKKLGTPTMRETPYDESDVSILSYELAGKKEMTLVIRIKDDEVTDADFYNARAGQIDAG